MAAEDHIDKLLKNAHLVPVLVWVGTVLCLFGFTVLLLVGTNAPWILWFSLACMVMPTLTHVGILRARWILRGRGYHWIGWWQAAILNRVVGNRLAKLPPADEFLALPGAERDVRSIVRVLVQAK